MIIQHCIVCGIEIFVRVYTSYQKCNNCVKKKQLCEEETIAGEILIDL